LLRALAAGVFSELVYPKLVDEAGGQPRIKANPPTIFHPDEARDPGMMDVHMAVLGRYRETLAEDRRVLFDRFRLVDVAMKVVGIGSVGTICMVALFMSIADKRFFLQIKQANASVLEAYAGASAYSHHGQPIPQQGKWLGQVVRGYFNYHAVPTNSRALATFRDEITKRWRRTLNRRSEKGALTWKRMKQLVADFLPKPRILHPWPHQRFAVRHLR
jgi:hypothetical protein